MKFTVEIDIKGDDLRTNTDLALAAMLREVAGKVEQGFVPGTFRPVIDVNGNTVGQWGMR